MTEMFGDHPTAKLLENGTVVEEKDPTAIDKEWATDQNGFDGEKEEKFLGEDTAAGEKEEDAYQTHEDQVIDNSAHPFHNAKPTNDEESDSFMFVISVACLLMIAFILYCMCIKSVGEEEQPHDRKVVNAEESEMTETSVTDYA